MPVIHPTAIIEPGAELAPDVTVGPYAYIGKNVRLGAGCVVHHHASIEGHTTAGERNEFFPNCVIGAIPQDLKYKGGNCRVVIGNDNRFREACTVHIGTEDGGGFTRIGNHNLLMVNVHIAHDCILANHCIIANNSMLAGHIVVLDHATFGGGVAVTHFITIGEHAFIGGLSAVVHDVPPFMISDGHPASVRGANINGLKRRGFSEEQIKSLKTAYRLLFSDTKPLAAQAVELEKLYPESAEIKRLLEFLSQSAAGKFGRFRETLRGKTPWDQTQDSTDPAGQDNQIGK